MVKKGYCRGRINKDTARIKRVFKWAARKQIVPITTYQSLTTVEGLRVGRSDARETEPVRPVAEAVVEETLQHALPIVADMAGLQLLTGARPGEVVIMRAIDIDMTGLVWMYHPRHHKNAYRGHPRNIALGPQAQEIVKRYLKPNVEAILFSPAQAVDEQNAERRRNRKSPMTPSQRKRKRKAKPRRTPHDRYSVNPTPEPSPGHVIRHSRCRCTWKDTGYKKTHKRKPDWKASRRGRLGLPRLRRPKSRNGVMHTGGIRTSYGTRRQPKSGVSLVWTPPGQHSVRSHSAWRMSTPNWTWVRPRKWPGGWVENLHNHCNGGQCSS